LQINNLRLPKEDDRTFIFHHASSGAFVGNTFLAAIPVMVQFAGASSSVRQ